MVVGGESPEEIKGLVANAFARESFGPDETRY